MVQTFRYILAAVLGAGLILLALSQHAQDVPPKPDQPNPLVKPLPQPAPLPCPGPNCPRRPRLFHAGDPAAYKIQVAGGTLDGEEITTDLPVDLHMRNTGGNDRTPRNPSGEPGKGYGLCVFTSIEHESRYQNIRPLHGLQKWMTFKPGGGYPQKVDQILKAFCAEKNLPVPDYIQHTGGEEEFLVLALKTGRMPCVTYAGSDGIYYDQQVAHMVNLVHLSDKWAAILDNNYPGKYLWMPKAEFLRRWRAHGGGWAVVFLNPPPPPIPTN